MAVSGYQYPPGTAVGVSGDHASIPWGTTAPGNTSPRIPLGLTPPAKASRLSAVPMNGSTYLDGLCSRDGSACAVLVIAAIALVTRSGTVSATAIRALHARRHTYRG